MNRDTFEVYTYFGRVLARFKIGENELHHRAQEQARRFMRSYTGKCWVRLV